MLNDICVSERPTITGMQRDGQFEARLAAARPRLMRLAWALGQGADAEDIAQETLLEAWRHRDRLTAPEGIDAWLSAICRVVCRRHAAAHPTPLSLWRGGDGENDAPEAAALADPQADDPLAELERQDVAHIIDRALGHLAPEARAALVLAYIADMPQREIAARLGLSLKACEARLLRARRQLRVVLGTELRAEAVALDLLPPGDAWDGWRETREWCHECGRRHLRGIFAPLPDGRVNMRLRCPACSPPYAIDMTETGGLIDLGGITTFRPALKRMNRVTIPAYRAGLTTGAFQCHRCKQQTRLRILASSALGVQVTPGRYYVTVQCACGHQALASILGIATCEHPALRRFEAAHPRWVAIPDVLTRYEEQPAYRCTLVDGASAARCVFFAEAQTLAVLATFEER